MAFDLKQKVVAYKTTESWKSVPHVSFIYENNAEKLLQVFNELKNSSEVKISLNTLFLRIIVEAIKNAPQVNAHIKYNPRFVTGKIDIKKEINFSMPLLLESGEMITVNLRNFEQKTLAEMQIYINDINERIKNCNIDIPLREVCIDELKKDLKKGRFLKVIRTIISAPKCKKKDIKAYKRIPPSKKILPQDLVPGTITVSNIGSLYKNLKGTISLLEVIPPQVFAIGINAIQNNNLSLCFSFDHRALNFSDIIPFIKKLDLIFENSEIITQWFKVTSE